MPNPNLDDLAELFAEVDERIAAEEAAAEKAAKATPDDD